MGEHRLCTYILAQHKKRKDDEKKKKKAAAKLGKDAKDTKEPKDKLKTKPSNGDKKKKKKSKDKDKDSDDEKKKKKKKDKKKKEKEAKNGDRNADADDKLSDDIDDLSITSDNVVDDAGAIDLAVTGVQKFMNANPDATTAEVAEVVVNQQMSSALKSHDKVHILIRAVITPSFYKEKQIEKYAPFVQKITLSNPIMERHLISAVESICIDKPKNFPVMLKQLYDEEALEEEVILQWAFDGRSTYTADAVDEEKRSSLRGEAEPFITWLQDDDDSSGSDSD